MKKIISCLALAIMLFACSKEEAVVPSNLESSIETRGGLTVTTDEASYILPFGAISGGSVSQSGGGKNVTERGVCFSTIPNPTIDDETVPSGSGSGTFTSILSFLGSGTTYYVRAYANKTEKGKKGKEGSTTTTYGNEVSFTTPLPIYGEAVTDIDGNTYTTIKIGTQWWMVENLKTTTYRNDTPIEHITDNSDWEDATTGAYCDYDNHSANSDVYGRLYNSNAASNPLIAPDGWKVASLGDFFTLANYLGSDGIGGGRMKEAGFTHWSSPNTNGDNSSGFTAVGAGRRSTTGVFCCLGEKNNFWTSYSGYQLFLLDHDSGSWHYASGTCVPASICQNYGASIRCIKDE